MMTRADTAFSNLNTHNSTVEPTGEAVDFGKISDSIAPAPVIQSMAPPAARPSRSYAGTLDAPRLPPMLWALGAVALVAVGALLAIAYERYERGNARAALAATSEEDGFEPLTDESELAAAAITAGGIRMDSIRAEVGSPAAAPVVIELPEIAVRGIDVPSSVVTRNNAPARTASTVQVVRETQKSSSNLPATPSRDDVTAALMAVRPSVMACAEGRHGKSTVEVSVAPSGRVRTATVHGTFEGSSEGSCMARAVRTAKFPAFSRDTFVVSFPYQL
ncbi:MAG: hypothetical protein KC417_09995 [Myxococcales bacterium]|nr:hypothetical protein [Myxococcales bacterium]